MLWISVNGEDFSSTNRSFILVLFKKLNIMGEFNIFKLTIQEIER